MIRKMLKNSWIAAAFIFMAGMFCMIPKQDNKVNQKVEVTTSATAEETLSSDKKWIQTLDAASEYELSLNEETGQYEISTASELAHFAYQVNSGANSYDGKEVVLTADIDLSGALWTPIGTDSNPFRGSFLGGYHTISNIVITDDSLWDDSHYYHALFGVIGYGSNDYGALVSDLRVSGYYINTTTIGGTKATIVASGQNYAMVVNCRDEMNKITAAPSVGGAGLVLKGGYFSNGTSVFDATLNDKTTIDSTLTVENSSEGYLARYTLGNSNAGIYDWGVTDYYISTNGVETEKSLLNDIYLMVALDSNLQEFDSGIDFLNTRWGKQAGSAVKIPVKRTESDLNDTTSIYARLSGYEPTIPAPDFSNGITKEIYFTAHDDIEITIDYGYGHVIDENGDKKDEHRTVELYVAYDAPFSDNYDLVNEDSYIWQRAGYELGGFTNNYDDFNDLGNSNNYYGTHEFSECYNPLASHFQTGQYWYFPIEGETYNMVYFDSNMDSKTYINFAISSNEGGSFKDLKALQDSIKEAPTMVIDSIMPGHYGDSDAINDLTTDENGYYVSTIEGNTSTYPSYRSTYVSGDGIITFTLNKGYTLSTTAVGNGESVSWGLTGHGQGSGVYLNFRNHTGTGSSYTTNANNDDYAPVAATLSSVKNEDGSTTYTIDIDSLVGGDGEIWIVVEREWEEIDLTPVWAGRKSAEFEKPEEFEKIAGAFDYSWTINQVTTNIETTADEKAAKLVVGSETETGFDNETYKANKTTTLKIRYGEYVKLSFAIDSANANIISSVGITDANYFTSNIAEGMTSATASYSKAFEFDTTSAEFNITPKIVRRETQVSINYYIEESAISAEDFSTKAEFKTIALNINNGEEWLGVNSKTIVLMAQSANQDVFNFRNNGYYWVSKIEVDSNEKGVEITEGKTSCDSDNSPWLTDPYESGQENVNHTIKVYLKKKTYNLNYVFTINGIAITEYQKEKLFDSVPASKTELNWGTINSDTYTLNNIGKGVIKEKSTTLTSGETKDGFLASSINGSSVTMGTYDTTVTVDFEYKSIDVIVDSSVSESYTAISGAVTGQAETTVTFNCDTTDGTISVSPTTFSSISISTKYYLIGWYLDNGQVVVETEGYSNILTKAAFIDAMVAASANNETEFKEIKAIVGARTLSIKANAGTNGGGELYYNGSVVNNNYEVVIASGLTFGSSSTITHDVATIYSNIGHTFSSWSANYGSVNEGTYSLSLSGFADMFGLAGATSKYWDTFAVDEAKAATAILTANWAKINYIIKVDGENTIGSLQLGSTFKAEALAENGNYRIGQAKYTVNTSGTDNSVNGTKKDGYNVIGYKASGVTDVYNLNTSNTFNLAALKLMLSNTYYFTPNDADSAIAFTTIRDEAVYKLYIKESEYYTLTTTATGEESWGGVDTNKTADEIYVNIEFNSSDLSNFDTALNEKITLEREGYNLVGFKYASNPDKFTISSTYTTSWSNSISKSDSGVYNIPDDITITPIWERKSNHNIAGIDFINGASESTTYYLANDKEILQGILTVTGKSLEIGTELGNGETITGFGFKYTNETSSTFNIAKISSAGTDSIVFTITVKDNLTNEEFTYESAAKIITAYQNDFVFSATANSIQSYYTGTSEFVSANGEEQNVTFDIKYNWKGDEISAADSRKFKLVDWFENFVVYGEYNVGESRNLGIFNKSFSSFAYYKDDAEGHSSSFTAKNSSYEDLFAVGQIEEIVEIVPAPFTITFEDGSTFYDPNYTTIVTTKVQANNTFTSGASSFEFSYDSITLKKTEAGTYTGEEDSSKDKLVFEIVGLKINDINAAEYLANFEWNISKESNFTLIGTDSALNIVYDTKLLAKVSGNLALIAGTEKINISGVKIGGNDATATNGRYYVNDGKDIFMAVNGSGSTSVSILINPAFAGTYRLEYTVSTPSTKYILGLVERKEEDTDQTVIAELETKFDSVILGQTSFAETFATTLTAGKQDKFIYATDLAKVEVDYNGGANENGAIYVASGEEIAYGQINYAGNYAGLSFAGFAIENTGKYAEGNTSAYVTVDNANSKFVGIKAGPTTKIKAMWNLSDSIVEAKNTTLSLTAATSATTIYSTDGENSILSYIGTKPSSISATFTLAGVSGVTITKTGTDFTIKNANGFTGTDLNGTYTLNASFKYNDGIRAEQTKVAGPFSFTVEVNKVALSLTTTAENLVYNGKDQKANVAITAGESGTLASLPKTITIAGLGEVKNAGNYNFTATIATNYNTVYTLTNNEISFSIAAYEIELGALGTVLSKTYGTTDPELSYTMSIPVTGENVKLAFASREEGESVGTYSLNNPSISPANSNYTLNSTGYSADFEIKSPDTLHLEIKEMPNYVYNGLAPTGADITYDATGKKFYLNVYSNSTVLDSVEAKVGYAVGQNIADLAESDRAAYADGITVTIASANKNVGNYTLTFAMEDSITNLGWSDLKATETKLSITEKEIVLTKISKVFDLNANFSYTSTDASENVGTFTLSGIVEGDAVVITGTFDSERFGERTIKTISLSGSAAGNYTLNSASATGEITASSQTVTIATTVENLNYGDVAKDVTAANLLKTIPVSIKVNETDVSEYVEITGVSGEELAYSTANFLRKGSYKLGYTYTSAEYGITDGKVLFDITINPIALTITNTSKKITKVYDGNESVLDEFVGQNVGATGGYYAATGLKASDIVTITSATYNDETINAGKTITAVVGGADEANYTISQNITGDITKIDLTINKNGNTTTFVEDGITTFGNSSSFVTSYEGNLDSFMTALTAQSTFMTRTGYTQTGWTFGGVNLAEMTTQQKEALLAAAVADANNEITLDAVWEINKYTLTITQGNTTTTGSGEYDYYSTVNAVVTADEGYKFAGITGDGTDVAGKGTRNGSFTVLVDENKEITVNTEQITVVIKINYNEPAGFENKAFTSDEGWATRVEERTLSFFDLSNPLPTIYLPDYTYDFVKWTTNGEDVSKDAALWEIIDGENLTEDVTTPIEFTANWEAADIEFIANAENAAVTVKQNGTAITGQNGIYSIKYGSSVEISIVADDFYKWTGYNTSDSTASVSGTVTNSKTGTLTISNIVKNGYSVSITIDGIKIEAQAAKEHDLAGTSIITNGEKAYETTDVAQISTVEDFITTRYAVTAGTYTQTGWYYYNDESQKVSVEFDDDLKQLIIEMNGGNVPTTDFTMKTLYAEFVGETYTVTFEKGEQAGATFAEDESASTVTRTWTYGQEISNLPVLEFTGMYYSWKDAAGKTFENGNLFTTTVLDSESPYEFVLTADWSDKMYNLTVEKTTLADKISSIKIEGNEYLAPILVQHGTGKDVTVALATGYEIDKTNTSATNATLTFDGNVIHVNNVTEASTLTIVVKAKDYTLSIKTSAENYYTLSKSSYAVFYGMDITNIFEGQSFTRKGYTFAGFTYNGQAWSKTVYDIDGNVELVPTWTFDASANYITATATATSGLVYNGQEQTVATSAFIVDGSSSSITLNAPLGNGEKITKVVYIVNGEEKAADANFALKYTNAIDTTAKLVVTVADTLSANTRTIESEVAIKIAKANIIIDEYANLVSYYSGTNTIYPTGEIDYGVVKFEGGAANSELTISKVEMAGDVNNNYDAGASYNTKYFFTVTAEFSKDNYANIVEEGGVYSLTSTAIKVEVVKTPITLTVSGQSFVTGEKKNLDTTKVEITKPDYVNGFNVTISSLATKTATAGEYDTIEEFDLSIAVKKAEEDKTSNFDFVIAGKYEILSTENTYTITLDAKYFDPTSALLDLDDRVIKVTSVECDGETTSIASKMDYEVDGTLIYSIEGNGTSQLKFIVLNGKEVKVNFTLEGNDHVLAWTNDLTSDFTLALQTLAREEEKSKEVTFSSSANAYYAIVTEYKAVEVDYVATGAGKEWKYVRMGETLTLDEKTWTGFEFDSWTAGSDLTVSGNAVTAGSTILPSDLKANWTLETPDFSVADVTTMANPTSGLSLTKGRVVSSFANENNVITYTYVIKNASGDNLGSFPVEIETTSAAINGEYTLTVTAEFEGQQTSASKTFIITVNKLTITQIEFNKTEVVYSNADIVTSAGIDVTLTMNEEIEQTYSLADLVDGKVVGGRVIAPSDTTNVGTKTFEFDVDEDYFNTFTFSQNVEITEYQFEITQDDVDDAGISSKKFGELDPTLEITKEFFGETVTITLQRESGENVKDYELSVKELDSANYKVSSINAIFTIEGADGTLNITVDSTLEITYNGQAPVFTLTYNDSVGKWQVGIDGGNSSTITIGALTGEVYKSALNGVTLSTTVSVAGDYTGENIVAQGGAFQSYGISANFTIKNKDLILTKVEKTFDGTEEINNLTTVEFSGLVDGDDVTLNGTFDSAVVGTHSLSGLELTGTDAANYNLLSSIAGKISKLVLTTESSVNVDLEDKEYIYGELGTETELTGIKLAVNSMTNLLDDGFVTVVYQIKSTLSTSNFACVEKAIINFKFSSANIDGLNVDGYDVEVDVKQKEIDLSSLVFSREFEEGNTKIDPNDAIELSTVYGIIDGDEVKISENSAYVDENGDEIETAGNWNIKIVLEGKDGTNYKAINATGKIANVLVSIVVNDEKHFTIDENGDVQYIDFVDDGKQVNYSQTVFEYAYPPDVEDEVIQSTYDSIQKPSRDGYTFISWVYNAGTSESPEYRDLKADMKEVFKQVSEKVPGERNLNIYPVWEVETFTLSVSGENIQTGLVDSKTVTYYSTQTIEVAAQKGYKITSFEVDGTVAGKETSQLNKNTASVVITGISSDVSIKVNTAKIEIVVKVEANDPDNSLYGQTITGNYLDLNALSLPALSVTAGTYRQTGYEYLSGKDGEGNDIYAPLTSVKEAVDVLYPTLDTDKEVKIRGIWIGETYTISFNANGGTISNDSELIVQYGSTLPTLPTVSKTGMNGKWICEEVEYKTGDKFTTIGTYDNGWKVVFEAQFENATYDLEVVFDSKLNVSSNNSDLTTGDIFKVTYNETEIVLVITPNEGYGFEIIDEESFKGEIAKENNSITIKNLTENQTITFASTKNDNTLEISSTYIAEITAEVDGTDVEISDGKIVAKTESNVVLTFVAEKGYVLDETCAIFSGSGNLSKVMSGDNIVLTWSGFTADATLTVEAKPAQNTISFVGINDTFTSLKVNGNSVTDDETVSVYTEETITISGVAKYGYENITLSTQLDYLTISQSCTENADKVFEFSATIEGFKEGFTITFAKTAREYNFTLAVKDEFATVAQITSESSQTVAFGGKVDLKTQIKSEYVLLYEFIGWEDASGNILSLDAETAINLTDAIKELLESEDPIRIFANYKLRAVPVEIKSTGKGSLNVAQPELSVDQDIANNSSSTINLLLDENVVITVTPNKGYELDKLYIDGIEVDAGDYGYEDEGKITIFVSSIDPIEKVEIVFKASDVNVYVQAGTIVNYNQFIPSDRGGKVYLSDAEGNKKDENLYLENEKSSSDKGLQVGVDYKFISKTDNVEYLVVEANAGFDFDLTVKSNNAIRSSKVLDDGRTLYIISEVKDELSLVVFFTARENKINATLASVEEGENGQLIFTAHNAGRINIATSDVVSASINNQYTVSGSVITGYDFTIEAWINMGYKMFVDNAQTVYYYLENADGTVTKYEAVGTERFDFASTGYKETFALTLSEVNANVNIYIVVEPKQYNVNLVTKFGENTSTVNTTVHYGQNIVVEGVLGVVPEKIEGFTFGGYFTLENGAGEKYIDDKGKVVKTWTENGYRYNGTSYVLQSNYNETTNTFTLYTYWIFEKTTIEMKFAPSGIETSLPNASKHIREVITNSSEIPLFTYQSSEWYAEVKYGTILKLAAPTIDGYQFVKWVVANQGVPGEYTDNNIELDSLAAGEYTITLVYNPEFRIIVKNEDSLKTDGGISWASQADKNLGTSGIYDFEKYLTLNATAAEGYNFLYWKNVNTGVSYFPTSFEDDKYYYTFDQLLTNPLEILAVFEGKAVNVSLDSDELLTYHTIRYINVNGTEHSGLSKTVPARIGDNITIAIKKNRGYTFTLVGGNFTYTIDSVSGDYIFTYDIDLNGVVASGNEYKLDISFTVEREEISITLIKTLNNAEQSVISDELAKAGTVRFVDSNDIVTEIDSTKTLIHKYGETNKIEIVAKENYIFKQAMLTVGGQKIDITDRYANNRIVLSVEFIDRYFAKEMSIQIFFERQIWIQTEYRATDFEGEGTKAKPFIIADAADMALLAYLVNNGIVDGEMNYAEAYYKVTNNIDFEGKYWEPIGTQANPFRGTIDLGDYQFSGVEHYLSYTNPKTSYSGLFWIISKDAKIIQATDGWTWIWIVIGIALAVIVLVVVLIVVIRKIRKKKLEGYGEE